MYSYRYGVYCCKSGVEELTNADCPYDIAIEKTNDEHWILNLELTERGEDFFSESELAK